MSVVTSIILITASQDGCRSDDDPHPNVYKLNEYLRKENQGSMLVEVSDYSGGNKGMTSDVFLAGINYLDTENFLEVFKSIQWESPEFVRLFLRGETDDFAYREYTPND